MKMPGFDAENSFNKTSGYYEMTKIESLTTQGSIYPALYCKCKNDKKCGSETTCVDATGQRCILIWDKKPSEGGMLKGCVSDYGKCKASEYDC